MKHSDTGTQTIRITYRRVTASPRRASIVGRTSSRLSAMEKRRQNFREGVSSMALALAQSGFYGERDNGVG